MTINYRSKMKSIRRETLYSIWALAETANRFNECDCLRSTIEISRELCLALFVINKKCVKIKNDEYNGLCEGCKAIKTALGDRFDDIFKFLRKKQPAIEKSYQSFKKLL